MKRALLSPRALVLLSGMATSATLAACNDKPAPKASTPAVEAVEAAQAPQAPQAKASPRESSLVELKLVDKMDEPRGYCLDIAGGRGANAPLDKGLQAHTCYDFNGSLLEDQSFDAAAITQGKFEIPYFKVCMTASSTAAGASLELAPCAEKDTQKFSLEADGTLVLQSKPELCVTVSSTEKKTGRGGKPPHVMRPVSMEPCAAAQKAAQNWATFKL